MTISTTDPTCTHETASPIGPISPLAPIFCLPSSPAIDKVAASLVKLQAACQTPKKSSVNPHFGSTYADLASLFEALRQPAKEALVAILQPSTTSSGAVHVQTIVIHESGQWIASDKLSFPVSGRGDPQAYMSALTYCKRASLQALLGLAAEEDDDGNAAVDTGGTNGANAAPRGRGAKQEINLNLHGSPPPAAGSLAASQE